MKIHFIKCHGSGNDFALIDEYNEQIFSEKQREIIAQAFSDRSGLVGSDGVLFYLSSNIHDVQMRMFNPDGSEPQTCANGLRCIGRYAEEKLNLSKVTIEIMKGHATAQKTEDIFPGIFTTSVDIGPISLNTKDLPLIFDQDVCINRKINTLSNRLTFTALSAPNPHLVSVVESIDESELVEIGSLTERAPPELPERANVSFVLKLSSNALFVSTFERGAGITGSCGSAMASSSVAACLLGIFEFGTKIKVINRNGIVFCTPQRTVNDEIYVNMTGNATFVYEADVYIDYANKRLSNIISGSINLDEIDAYSQLRKEAQEIINQYKIKLAPEGFGIKAR